MSRFPNTWKACEYLEAKGIYPRPAGNTSDFLITRNGTTYILTTRELTAMATGLAEQDELDMLIGKLVRESVQEEWFVEVFEQELNAFGIRRTKGENGEHVQVAYVYYSPENVKWTAVEWKEVEQL